jgi:hypothetical protein
METIKADKTIIHAILEQTKSLLEKHGSRIPGTKGSTEAAAFILQIMKQFCDQACAEEFFLYPGSLFNIGRIISVAYILSALFFFISGIFVYFSFGLIVLAFINAIIHYFLYGSFFDRLFKKRTGCNAIGTIEPANEVKQQVIVMGHHDSAYVFSFLSGFQRIAGIRFLFAMLFYMFVTAISVTAAVHSIFYGTDWQLSGTLFLTLTGLLFLLPLFFFVSAKLSPGAGDNLNGSSIAVHIGKYFAERKRDGMALKNTRLILLSTDGEEAGQRGAIAYARRHKQELTRVPTHVLNINSVYTVKDLAVLTRDRHGFLPLSPQLAKDCTKIAAELGYGLKTIAAPFGSCTDAAAFAKEGIPATAIIGMPTTMFAIEFIYHTFRDTVENIEPEAVEAVFK